MKFIEENTDHYFINSAYLSELWAAHDLKAKAEFGFKSSNLAQQIDDEFRHAEMLKKAMISHGFEPIHDLKFAMQNVIYKKICALDLSETYSNEQIFLGVHEITEKRALWNYKTYIRGGNNNMYKKILTQIIKEEQAHFRKIDLTNPVLESIHNLDYWVHRTYIGGKYNNFDLLRCLDFWKNYFGPGI